ncbi:hypothetical protein T4D_4065 [Trichinella pseudospiralis]|uniref:Uncharacterized protein n=1 Tax=Trichinella pseudospiralis TaxID=6337 RepID=A0A0V1DMN8_TRIPS|nr:hypothetical protein T4D_4065 [Trichinella pseudospiralis]
MNTDTAVLYCMCIGGLISAGTAGPPIGSPFSSASFSLP